MSVIGFRVSTKEIRYAILECGAESEILFVNKNREHCIKYPASMLTIEDKLLWIKKEIDRILIGNPGIERAYLKINEFGHDTMANRETAYIDSIILLSSIERNIPIVRKLNNQISSNTSKSREYAEERVGKTDRYWNTTMADAILVAYWGLKCNV